MKTRKVLLTGASGYVGGRLLKKLEEMNISVRCLARQPEYVKSKVHPRTEVVKGDVLNFDSLRQALKGMDSAYYLVHSMQDEAGFEERDRTGARHFARAAKHAGVKQIIYLGGLGSDDENLSPHLRSRHEVGHILKESGAVVVEFRASIVIGSGSLSFEMVRALVERLPVMITPRWVRVLAQPIAINDLIQFLLAPVRTPLKNSAIFEIGGQDRISYEGLMKLYARERNLRRVMIPVPFLTPYLSGLWLGLVTPLFARIGRTLIKSITHPTIVRYRGAEDTFGLHPMGIQDAIHQAMRNEDEEFAATRWSDAVSSAGDKTKWGGIKFGARIIDSRSVHTTVDPGDAFHPIARLGGSEGWYYANFLWKIRGLIDMLVGGVGLRRGRPHPTRLRPGDSLDFWRVEEIESDKRLRLKAEMKMPGRAWLQFDVEADPDGSVIRQTALFDPVGLLGLLYWYALYPLHQLIFAGMLREIKKRADQKIN